MHRVCASLFLSGVHSVRNSSVRLAVLLVISAFLLSKNVHAQKSVPPNQHLTRLREVLLSKKSGNISQIIELPDGSFLIRDSTYVPLTAQSVEHYSPFGRVVGRIGSYGSEPGRFNALKQIAYTEKSREVWIVDMLGRVSRFDSDGHFLNSSVIQAPTFHPYGIAIDEQHGRYYLTGCVALHFYLDLGCKMIHEYELGTDKFIRSFMENEKIAVDRKYFSVEDYVATTGPTGLYAMDAPVRKFYKITSQGNVTSYDIPSKVLGTLPVIDPTQPAEITTKGQYLLESLLANDKFVVISANVRDADSHLLEIFTLQGQPVALDVPTTGSLIGESPRGTFWFSEKHGERYVIAEYAVQ